MTSGMALILPRSSVRPAAGFESVRFAMVDGLRWVRTVRFMDNTDEQMVRNPRRPTIEIPPPPPVLMAVPAALAISVLAQLDLLSAPIAARAATLALQAAVRVRTEELKVRRPGNPE